MRSLLQLARALGLTSLKTSDITFSRLQYCSVTGEEYYDKKAAVLQLVAAIVVLLQQLPRLAVLELPGMPMYAAAMEQLGRMQGLQKVRLGQVVDMPMCELQHLPSSIALLHYSSSKGGRHSNKHRQFPELQHLTGLLRLELHCCAVRPAMLGVFTCLETLKLHRCNLLPAPAPAPEPAPGPTIVIRKHVYEAEGTAALLDALSKLTCLQNLSLSLKGLDTVSTTSQRFAALTASTQLRRLAVSPLGCVPLATGATQYMFPAGRELPSLQELLIAPCMAHPGSHQWCMDGADIHSIATCCKGLRKLNISYNLSPGAEDGWMDGFLSVLPAQRTSRQARFGVVMRETG
jgi:hypothetical protein